MLAAQGERKRITAAVLAPRNETFVFRQILPRNPTRDAFLKRLLQRNSRLGRVWAPRDNVSGEEATCSILTLDGADLVAVEANCTSAFDLAGVVCSRGTPIFDSQQSDLSMLGL